MVWRKWNVLAVLLLANYIVLSSFAALVANSSNGQTPTRSSVPTFTPRAQDLRRVSPLPYDFLPTPRATIAATEVPSSATTVPAR